MLGNNIKQDSDARKALSEPVWTEGDDEKLRRSVAIISERL